MTKLRLLAALSAVLLLCAGCTPADAPASSESPAAPTEAPAQDDSPTEAPTEDPYPVGDTLPVLSIEAKEDSLDFVTQPVAAHVAASIASWTPGYRMPPAPYYEACTVTLTDTDGTVLLSDAAADVKVRGNWTTTYDKKSLRLKFQEKQSLLRLNDGNAMKNWVLLAEYKDPSLLRTDTALQLSRALLEGDGLYAADSTLVEVQINGNYWGVYLLTEQQQTGSHRVDITEPEQDYTGTDIGYFMEFDGYFTEEDALHSFSLDYADNAPLIPFDWETYDGVTVTPLPEGRHDPKQEVGITVKSDLYSQAQHDFIAAYMSGVYRILYAAAYEDTALRFDNTYTELTPAPDLTPEEAVRQAVDVDSLADMYIISELTCDADIYWSSFFMDVDFGEGGDRRLRFEAPWDFDSALGNKDRCADGKGFYAASIVPDVNDQYDAVNPWLCVLMQADWYRDLIAQKWTAAYDAGVFDRASAHVRESAALYSDAFDCNEARWHSIRQNAARNEWCAASARCKTPEETADYLASWLDTRTEFLNSYWHK